MASKKYRLPWRPTHDKCPSQGLSAPETHQSPRPNNQQLTSPPSPQISRPTDFPTFHHPGPSCQNALCASLFRFLRAFLSPDNLLPVASITTPRQYERRGTMTPSEHVARVFIFFFFFFEILSSMPALALACLPLIPVGNVNLVAAVATPGVPSCQTDGG